MSEATPIRAERLARDLSDCLPSCSILVADTGFSATWTAQLTELQSLEQLYLRAAGSLGWAFPAAIGAACAAPDTPVSASPAMERCITTCQRSRRFGAGISLWSS
jgi:acetolactate synthase-1/2/3 large subunit